MAITRAETRIQFGAANSTSLVSGAAKSSDTVSLATTTVMLGITIKVDNKGTPASGDTCTVYMLPSAGDPDGVSTDEHASNSHGILLAVLNTNLEDPAIRSLEIPSAFQSAQFRFLNNAASNSYTISAVLTEVKQSS